MAVGVKLGRRLNFVLPTFQSRLAAHREAGPEGLSQRQIAELLGVSKPAISQQLKSAPDIERAHPQLLLEAAGPVLKTLASEHGYQRLAVFGSVARHQARAESDIDLLVEAPAGTSSFEFNRFTQLIEQVLGREVDLVDYGGLKPELDDDIRREAVLL